MMSPSEKAADVATVTAAGAWFFGSLAHINEILQFIAFIITIVSAYYAIRFYRRRLNQDASNG
jgi:positive regulator of sigma E activity